MQEKQRKLSPRTRVAKTERVKKCQRQMGNCTDLGKISRLPHAVNPTEGDHVRALMTLGIHDIPEHVYTTLWLQNLHQGLLQSLLYCGSHR